MGVPENQNKLKFIWLIAKKTFEALNSKEKIAVFALIAIILASASAIFYNFWIKNTVPVASNGGALNEGVIGSPRYINPILAQTNEVDIDLTKLTFSSLFTIDSEGNLINDIVKEYSVSDDKKIYTIKINDNVLWHDKDEIGLDALAGNTDKDQKPQKEKLTADDVVFTVKAIQNPAYKSPIRANLVTADVEKIDDYTVKFSLKTPYEPFLQNLTFGILPRHIWQYINTDNVQLAEYNIKPVGSGPYKLERITKDKLGRIISIDLAANNDYYGLRPFIDRITFKFYKDQDTLVEALNTGEINATAYLSNENINRIRRADLKNYTLKTPRYFAIFFNPEEAKNLADKNTRLALNYLTDKEQIVKEVLLGNGEKIDTPVPPVVAGYSNQTKVYNFDPSYASTLLTSAGWVMQDDDFRAKEIKEKVKDKKNGKTTEVVKQGDLLEITLTTGSSPEFNKIASILQSQWQKGGVKVNLEFLSPSDIRSAIKDRSYDVLLFGEILNLNPDPFIFWHSSETKDPGLNLAIYSNKEVDSALENYRQSFDPNQKKDLLSKFQAKVVDDAPAVFLFNPYLNYAVESGIKEVDTKIITMPADRFSGIENWYIKTKRVWKK